MSQAALDYFESGVAIPAEYNRWTESGPTDPGNALSCYVEDRQFDVTRATFGYCIGRRMDEPEVGRRNLEEYRKIKARIADDGRPALIGLGIVKGHAVVAYACTECDDGRVSLAVYDPNVVSSQGGAYPGVIDARLSADEEALIVAEYGLPGYEDIYAEFTKLNPPDAPQYPDLSGCVPSSAEQALHQVQRAGYHADTLSVVTSTIAAGQDSVNHLFWNDPQRESAVFIFWYDGPLRVTVARPDGSVHSCQESEESPIVMPIAAGAESGPWSYEISLPVGLTTQSEESHLCTSLLAYPTFDIHLPVLLKHRSLGAIAPGGTPTETPQPSLTPMPTPGIIAFNNGSSHERGIYLINSDGTGLTRLTIYNDQAPVWSPDGQRIAFTSNRDNVPGIFVMDADGAHVRRLSTNRQDEFPVWSPDGETIAFESDYDERTAIYAMSPDGTGRTRLTSGPDGRVSWSPDGARMAFASFRNGPSDIYVMDADGSNQVNLSNRPGAAFDPDWSPDGSGIAFSDFYDVYVMDVNGSNQVNLTNRRYSHGCCIQVPLAWSPDGGKIAFAYSSFPSERVDIYVINADGTDQVNLTQNLEGYSVSQWFSWSPDSTQIALSMTRESDRVSDIYVLNADGTGHRRLTNAPEPVDCYFPAWRP